MQKICFSNLVFLSLLALSLSTFGQEIPGEYIVKFKTAKNRLNQQSFGANGLSQIKAQMFGGQFALVRRSSVERAEFSMQSLKNASPEIEYIEPNQVVRIDGPNDPDFSRLWGLGSGDFGIRAEQAWQQTSGNRAIVVAVIDTGIDYLHPDLKNNIFVNDKEFKGVRGKDDDGNGYIDDIYGYDFSGEVSSHKSRDDNGHGSHCAGTIAAVGNNGIGVIGVAPNVRLMPVKFLNAFGSGSTAGAIQAIEYAVKNGANVLSNSWGGGAYSKALEDVIKVAEKKNIVFIAAAGNDSQNNDKNPSYPASYKVGNIVSVAAIDRKGELASFSNYGAKSVHVAAPGVDILSTSMEGGYETLSGTSMATPHVSGIAALMLSKNSKLTPANIKQLLIRSSVSNSRLKGKVFASGQVSALNAMNGTKALK